MVTKINKEALEEYLDERWSIAQMKEAGPADLAFYNGIWTALAIAGIDVMRENGEHTIVTTPLDEE